MTTNEPPNDSADRNLLFGVLALEMDFISREALIAATSIWVLDKRKGLDQILLECPSLKEDEHALARVPVSRAATSRGRGPRPTVGGP